MTDDGAVVAGLVVGPVKSVGHAIDILRYISTRPAPEGVNKIARALSISPSSCFNILKTLVNGDLLEFYSKDKTYGLGTGLVKLAQDVLDESNTFSQLRPYLQRLANEFSVTTALWRITGRSRWILVGFVESPSVVRIHLSIGQRLPMFAGALGLCAAAVGKLQEEALSTEISKVSWRKRPTMSKYMADLRLVRRRGWALDDSQLAHGVANIAAPIVDSNARIRYCITCTMFSGEYSVATLNRIGETARTVASRGTTRIFGGTPIVK